MEFLPPALANLVKTQAVDLGAEVRTLLDQGKRRLTLGLGPGVDVPLLDEELFAAEVAMVERELIVATLRAEPDGYVVSRGWSNFGVYVWTDRDPLWTTVPHTGEVRGLRPGDRIALGSTPADAIQFTLPESPLVPPPRASRSARQRKAMAQRAARTPAPAPARHTPPPPPPAARRATPPPATRRTTPPPVARTTRPPIGRGPAERIRYQLAFDVALNHWQYPMVTFGPDPNNVIVAAHPDIGNLRAALSRNVDQPERGYDLFVKDPGSNLWVQPAGEEPAELTRGAVIRLKGPGNRLGFSGFVVELPEPARPVQRFGARETPTRTDIAAVLGLSEADLADTSLVKGRYRELARRFHPDRHNGEPGHVSRFLEIQACLDAWKTLS